MKNGYTTYKSVTVDTADQGKLILICYDVAIRNCKMALTKFDGYSQFSERTKHLLKAQDAVSELMGALKMDVGVIARNLYRIYEYLIYRLVQANVKNDKAQVQEVLDHLERLRDAWSQAVLKLKRETVSPVRENLSLQGLAMARA